MTPKQRRQQDIFKRRLSGSAMTEKESKKIKEALSQSETPATAGAGVGALSGSAMTEKEFKKIKEALQQAPEGLEDEALQPGQEYGMKKGGAAKPTKAQKKVGKVMREFKAGKLHSGKKGPVVKNPKQAIAIALSEAGMSKKKMMGGGMMSDGIAAKGSGIEMKSKGGMVRGQGIAIRGTKFKGIF